MIQVWAMHGRMNFGLVFQSTAKNGQNRPERVLHEGYFLASLIFSRADRQLASLI